jgi:hypothetical protein
MAKHEYYCRTYREFLVVLLFSTKIFGSPYIHLSYVASQSSVKFN